MSESNRNALAGSIVGLVSLLAAVAFFLLGFMYNAWHPGWMVFLVIPFASLFTDIIIKRNAVSAVTSFVWLLSLTAFFYLGFVYGKWHPGWLVFFAIPIADILMKIFTRSWRESGSNNCGCESCGGNSDPEQKG